MADEALIGAIKQHIRYRARYALIPYEEEDIKCIELDYGYTLVALMMINTPEYGFQDEDEPPVIISEKTPNIYICIPRLPTDMPQFNSSWNINIPIYHPIVSIKYPWLAWLIRPDNTILDGGHQEYPFTNEIPDHWRSRIMGSAICLAKALESIAKAEYTKGIKNRRAEILHTLNQRMRK